MAVLSVRVHPGARSARIRGWHGDALRVDVTEAPERGRANDAVVRLLSSALGVTRASVTVLQGHASRDKRVDVVGLEPAELEARLERVIEAEREER